MAPELPTGAALTASRAVAGDSARPPEQVPLVGRDEECNRFDRFLERDPPAGLVLEGDPGIGKTALWAEGVRLARERGFRVLSARPGEAEQPLAFAAVADLLAEAAPEIGRLPAPQRRALSVALLLEDAAGDAVEPRTVGAALLGTLRALAGRGPLLVAIDDLQWLDRASSTALRFALRRLADEPARVLATVRTHEDEGVIELGPGVPLERLSVAPLSVDALHRLIQLRLDATLPRPVMRRIYEQAGGSPLYALELARALKRRGRTLAPTEELPLPEALDAVLRERLAALPSETRRPLAAAAALAEPRLELLADEALEPAFEAGVLFAEGDRVRFTHPLLAAAAYRALPPRRRRALHRELADLPLPSFERAHHLALASQGADPSVAALLDDEAARARARGAPELAAALAEDAIRLGDPADPRKFVRRSTTAARYHIACGDDERARELLRGALGERVGDAERAEPLWELAALELQHDTEAGLALFRQARAAAAGEHDLEARIVAALAAVSLYLGQDLAESEQLAREAVEAAEHTSDAVLTTDATVSLAYIQFFRGLGFSLDLMERALRLSAGSGVAEAKAMMAFGWMCKWAGDIDRARGLLERASQMFEELGDSELSSALFYRNALEFLADNWQRALELANAVVRAGIDEQREWTRLLGVGARAVLYSYLGDEREARRNAAEALALGEASGVPHAVPLCGLALGTLELSLDRPREALATARRVTEFDRRSRYDEPALCFSFPLHAEAAIAVGELDEAAELLDWIWERAVRLDRAWALACAARCRGLLAAARGDEAGALDAFERALAEHERVQYRRFDLARTLLADGQTLRRFKRKRAAREAIEAATAHFDELGAKLWATKARRELARIAGRRRSEGLTETEQRVAELVSAGRSNKEVASELYVTVRTVETNLTKIYAKLGVRSRTELARRLSA